MRLKALAALTIAAIFCGAPLAAQAHQGHHHPPAKAKKVKKSKPKTSGIEIQVAVRAAAVRPGSSGIGAIS